MTGENTSEVSRSQATSPPEIDFHKIIHVLRKSVRVVLGTTSVALLAAFVYIWLTPRSYVSYAMVQVQRPTLGISTSNEEGREDLNSIESLKTIEQNLNNLSLMRRLVENTNLGLSAEVLGLPPRPNAPYTTDEKAISLGGKISAELQRGTRLIRISATHGDPIMAQKLATAVVKEYKTRLADDLRIAGEETNRVLLGEISRQQKKLQASEEALQAYRVSTGAVSLEESQNIIVGQLKDLNTRFAEAQGERLRLESAVGVLSKMSDRSGEKLLGIPAIGADPAVLDQKRALADLEAAFANLRQRYLPKHPKYIQIEGQLSQLRDGINRAALRAADRIDTLYATAKATEAKFGASLQEQEQKALKLSEIEIPYKALAQNVESDKVVYESYLIKLKEADASKGFDQDNIRLIDAATFPDFPSKPRKKLVLAGALLAGIFLGLGITAIRMLFDSTLSTVDEAEQILQLPVLAAIPSASHKSRGKSEFAITNDPSSLVAEGFRSLRTALVISTRNKPRKFILFTSALPGEGKTFCSVNYATSLAQQGYKTLLIDADIRLSSLSRLFFENLNSPGLSDCILKKTYLNEVCLETAIPDLKVLTAGTRLENASELLSSEEIKTIIDSAAKSFDRIVIDSAPVNAVSDALLLAGLVDHVCFVVRAGFTPRKASRHAVRMLSEAGRVPIGFVLNRVATDSGPGFYYHYSTGSYGHGSYGGKKTAPITEDVVPHKLPA